MFLIRLKLIHTTNDDFHKVGRIIFIRSQIKYIFSEWPVNRFPNSMSYYHQADIMRNFRLPTICIFSAMLFGKNQRATRHIGCIDPVCDPGSVVRDAYENARFLCDQYYLASPELELVEYNRLEGGDSIRIVYV